MKNIIPIRNKRVLALCFGISILCVPLVHAEDYPIFYESENPAYGNVAVPEIKFPTEPKSCAPDDIKCQEAYLNTLGEHLQGNISAQMTPSPVYSWMPGECALDNAQECENMEKRWLEWQARSETASLDFVQSMEKKDQEGLTCQNVYDWWGLTYVYKCQEEK